MWRPCEAAGRVVSAVRTQRGVMKGGFQPLSLSCSVREPSPRKVQPSFNLGLPSWVWSSGNTFIDTSEVRCLGDPKS